MSKKLEIKKILNKYEMIRSSRMTVGAELIKKIKFNPSDHRAQVLLYSLKEATINDKS